jgi:hypothetical protein
MKIKKILTVITVTLVMLSFNAVAFAEEFTDVPADHPYKDAVDFCQYYGFVKGTGSTVFEPDAKLTRGQFATLWCRTLLIKEQNHTFKDIAGLSNYYDTPAIVLNSLGVMNGTSATEFSPNGYVTREQLALLTMRTYNLGVANEDAYKQYADFAAISEWARDGINACINAKVLDGLYDGQNFKPGEPVTRAEICKLILNLLAETYDVTIGPLVGGTITASPTTAIPGTVITLTVTPDTGKQLKAGTLKYNDTTISGTAFQMPDEDVTVTAEFEDKPVTLESITITSEPVKKTYTAGEALDLSGLAVTAHYSNDTDVPVTTYTATPGNNSALNTVGTITVTISYEEGGVTKTATFSVTVNAA